jgi:hypothetical protein
MREFNQRMNQAFRKLALKPGDISESCSYHPVLCLGVDYKQDEIWGVSLIDGTHPMSCSLLNCGVRKLSPKQTWEIKINGPLAPEAREGVPRSKRCWNVATQGSLSKVGLSGPRKERRQTATLAAAHKKVNK